MVFRLLIPLFALVQVTSWHQFGAVAQERDDPAQEQPIEATSLFGQPLRRVIAGSERQAKLESQLQDAKKKYESDPDNVDHIIWLGRRLAPECGATRWRRLPARAARS